MHQQANSMKRRNWIMASGILAIAFVFAGAAHACPGKGPWHHHWSAEKFETMVNDLTPQLKLSKKQQNKVAALIKRAKDREAAIKQLPKEQKQEKLTAKRKLRFDAEDRLHEIFSCKQRETFRKAKRERKSQRMQEHYKKWREAQGEGAACGNPNCAGESCPHCSKAKDKADCPYCKKGKSECTACKKKKKLKKYSK